MSAAPPEFRDEPLGRDALRTTVHGEGGPLSRAAVLDRLERDGAFREALGNHLATAPFPAFFWETPAWVPAGLGRPYEHVLRAAPTLAGVAQDPEPFREHFAGAGPVVAFTNLGGDAELLVPRPAEDPTDSAHLASYLRTAPPGSASALLLEVARRLRGRLAASSAPTWLSTSGLGVSWVHVRLDATPKYYTHAPYRSGSS